MKADIAYETEYKKLNPKQKLAVDSLDGPVMVVAGPGTGKTQVLTLRIARILSVTDTPSSGVLCLTFTNAGVRAMRERLLRLIGTKGSEVYIATFHHFAIGLIEKYFTLLDFTRKPELLADTEAVALVDEILEMREWRYLRPRGDASRYFSDLKSLISLLKRENLTPEQFLDDVVIAIDAIKNNPDNISSRGARKGELKMESIKEIESLERTREVVEFYTEYENIKRERSLMDYDDVLAYAVKLAQTSEDVRADLHVAHLYVLVDEHQDSSGVQNAFLEAVWGKEDKPNIFVVGDDRQLIYGFGGASLEQFTRFRTAFGKAQEITLTDNYRSTQTILDTADTLLKSKLADGKLAAQKELSTKTKKTAPHGEKIRILECEYPRDEIILAARDIKQKIAEGVAPEKCAILVPKNHQVRSAVMTLLDQGVPVSAQGTVSFFSAPETATVRRVLLAISDPYNPVPLAGLLLDPAVGIPPLTAHKFLREFGTRKLFLETLINYGATRLGTDPIARLGGQLADFLESSSTLGIHGLVQKIGEVLFFDAPKDHDVLIRRVEIIRTFIHLLSAEIERNPELTIAEFLAYLDRLEQYGHEIPLAVFSADRGVRVLTLHGSKGLEFSHVYVAHLDEASLMKGKRLGFTLPPRIEAMIEQKNEMVARRELYVAITRAEETCTLSFPRRSYTGAELEPAHILADLPDDLVERKTLAETEASILKDDPTLFVRQGTPKPRATIAELTTVVAEEYPKLNVSVTLLNNFFECPWKWYFRNLLQLPEPKTESLLIGSIVHTGIEYLLKHRDQINRVELDETLTQCLAREYVTSEKLVTRTLREAKRILDNFEKTYLPHISDTAESERSISYRDPERAHLSCYGKIDMTEREDDRIVVVSDFKTGSSKSKSVIEKRDGEGRMSGLLRQLAMYTYLIENAERGTTVSESKLLFIETKPNEKDGVYATSIGAEEIRSLKQDIIDYDDLVRDGKWTERPCEAKLYGSSRECEYCAKARLLYSV